MVEDPKKSVESEDRVDEAPELTYEQWHELSKKTGGFSGAVEKLTGGAPEARELFDKMGPAIDREVASGDAGAADDRSDEADERSVDRVALDTAREVEEEATPGAAPAAITGSARPARLELDSRYPGKRAQVVPGNKFSNAWHDASDDSQWVINWRKPQRIGVNEVFNFSHKDEATDEWIDDWRKWEGAGKGWTQNVSNDEMRAARRRDRAIRDANPRTSGEVRVRSPRVLEGLSILDQRRLDLLIQKLARQRAAGETPDPKDVEMSQELLARAEAARKARGDKDDDAAKPGDAEETKPKPAEETKDGAWDEKTEAAKHDELRELRRSLGVERGKPWDSFNAGGDYDIGRVHSQEDYDKVRAAIIAAPKGDGKRDEDDKGKDSGKGGKKGGDFGEKKGSGEKKLEPGQKEYTLLSNGVFRIREADKDGNVTTRLVNAKGETITDTATEDDLWKKAGYGDPVPGYMPTVNVESRVEEGRFPELDLAAINAVQPTIKPGIAGWWNRVMGRTPQPSEQFLRLLNKPGRSPESRAELALARAYGLREAGYKVTAEERGIEKGFWQKVRENFTWKGVIKTAAIAAVAPALLAMAGFAIPLGAVAGYAAAGGLGKIVHNIFDAGGWKKTAAFAQVATTLLAGGVVTYGYFGGGIFDWIGRLFSGEAVPTGPKGAGFIPGDVGPSDHPGFLEKPLLDDPVIRGNGSVWSNLTHGLDVIGQDPDIGKLSFTSKQQFAEAFQKTIEKMGLQGELLGRSGRFIDWTRIPDGTVVNFSDMFENPKFMKNFCDTLYSPDYRHFAVEMTRKGMTVNQFLKEVAFAYNMR